MCEPTTIAMLTIAAMSAVTSHQQQSQMVEAQTEAINREQRLQENDLARQQGQQHAAAAAQMNEQARRAQKDMALFEVVTGEYGGGNSAARAGAVSTIQNGEALATIGQNASNAQGETSFRSLAVSSQAQSRLASLQRPSNLGTALRIGAAGLGAYNHHQALTKSPVK
jgi:ATPase subunit of ABC transporter with duplicated ATPase domains